MKIGYDWSAWREARERLGLQPNDEKFNKKVFEPKENETEIKKVFEPKENETEIKEKEKIIAKLKKGIEIEESDFKDNVKNIDGFLWHKNNLILVYIRDNVYKKKNITIIREYPDKASKFHIYWCITIRNMVKNKRFNSRYVMTRRDDGLFPIETNDEYGIDVGTYTEKLNVCRYCLGESNYHGYERSLPEDQKAKHVADFNIKEFFEEVGNRRRYEEEPTKTTESERTSYYSNNNADVAKNLKEKKQYKCEDCKVFLGTHGHKQYLHMHHLNLDKSDNNPFNLKILCVNCHMKNYHADTDWRITHASQIAECRRIKREQGISVE